MKLKKWVVLLLCCFITGCIFTGCDKKEETKAKIYPTFTSGENEIELNDFNLEKQGLSALVDMLRPSVYMPKDLIVSSFETSLDRDGFILSFTLSLDGYKEDKTYEGRYSFVYNSDRKSISYYSPEDNGYLEDMKYDENAILTFVDSQIKRVPIAEQMKKLNWDHYVLLYRSWSGRESSSPIVDATDNTAEIPVVTMEEYENGSYGVSDGYSGVFLIFFGGSGMTTENQIWYAMSVYNPSTVTGDRNFTMECDYQVYDGSLSFTRDYGENWIDSGLSGEEVNSLMEFYGTTYLIPPESYFISTDSNLPIAYITGNDPTVRVSSDGGATWIDTPLSVDYEMCEIKDVTRRVVGFSTAKDGYAAIGTDWTMGTGETKAAYYTHDGGVTWEMKELPYTGTSMTLTGMEFYNASVGALSLMSISDDVPTIYMTKDGGDTFTEIELPYDTMYKNGLDHLARVESLTFVDGTYYLKLCQDGEYNRKAIFWAKSTEGVWNFDSIIEETVHTVG